MRLLTALSVGLSQRPAWISAASLLIAPTAAHAHLGHGFDVPHFHVDDLMLVIGVIALLGVMSALIGRK